MFGLGYLKAEFERLGGPVYRGQVSACLGTVVKVTGLQAHLSPGDKCKIVCKDGRQVLCEVVGFHENRTIVMPFDSVDGIVLGSDVYPTEDKALIRPDDSWIGRVFNALGQPIDGKGPVGSGNRARPLRAPAVPAYERRRMGGKLDTGIRAINTFVPICKGQRMGIFAGSGVGKSTLLSMLVRSSRADVNVIGLIGERGREVQDFLQEQLGEEGLRRSVLVVATSDESPQMRRQAAYVTAAIAEEFRDRGLQVLCLMDSITRFATAQREIGLAVGEPPTTKGYPPSVFAELPKLLERAGPGVAGQGDITGVFTVLVEGDDTNEPIADAVRSIVDGHLVLDREIAERGRFPAIDVLRSVSRALPGCHTEEEWSLLCEARELIAEYESLREMIQIGAYRSGSNSAVDRAIAVYPRIEAFLAQQIGERASIEEGFSALRAILRQEREPPTFGRSERTGKPTGAKAVSGENVMPFPGARDAAGGAAPDSLAAIAG